MIIGFKLLITMGLVLMAPVFLVSISEDEGNTFSDPVILRDFSADEDLT